MKRLIVLFLIFIGCSISDYQALTTAVIKRDPAVLKNYLRAKGRYYLTHPHALQRDIKSFLYRFNLEVKKFTKAISIWPTPIKPSTKDFVKYTQNYQARAIINFEKGYVRVESLKNDLKKFKKALVYTMLMPEDPRSVDLFSDKIKLGGKPFLAGEIIDHEGKVVLYEWRANRYADFLIKNKYKNYVQNGKKVFFVEFPLVKNDQVVRAKKYKPFVEEYSKKYKISKTLIFAIIKTESDFNPYAVSYVPAFGLMQIVPTTAGVEGFERAYGYKKIPDKDFLFVPKNNINIGTAYLNLLFYKYLGKVKNPLSREYLSISAYNAGIGNVLRVFHIRTDRAISIINSLPPNEIYKRLIYRLPTQEARNYLPKVLKHKKLFIGL